MLDNFVICYKLVIICIQQTDPLYVMQSIYFYIIFLIQIAYDKFSIYMHVIGWLFYAWHIVKTKM